MQMYRLKLLFKKNAFNYHSLVFLCKTKWLNLCATIYGLGKSTFVEIKFRVNVKVAPSFVAFINNVKILLKTAEICSFIQVSVCSL